MTAEERTLRIRQLWLKVKMFVRLRKSLTSVQKDVIKREINEIFKQP
jgi:hypothetical protein